MNPRIVGLVFSLVSIAAGSACLVIVSKIVALRGPSYRWEYIPGFVILSLGMALTAYWTCRIFATRKP